MNILVTGDMGESLPPPYGGIMKRALLHAKDWREKGATIIFHVYYKHEKEDDLGAKAQYIYDFKSKPNFLNKIIFIKLAFLRSPILFTRLLWTQLKVLSGESFFHILYCSGRGILIDRLLIKEKPDAVLAETAGFQSFVATLVAKKYNIPVVLIHSAEILIAPKLAPLWRQELEMTDVIISTSRHCARGPEAYCKDKSKMKLIYSGVNFSIFNRFSTQASAITREYFSLPKGKFVVMSVGSLHERKGHTQLFEAILTLPKESQGQFFVVLCGSGSIPEMMQKVKELGFPETSLKIFQKLTEESLAELYSAADCFCFPSVSDRECMGLALKESLCVGLPVAAYRSGGIPEAVEEGVNGFLADVDDIAGLARALLSVQTLSVDKREEMKKKNIAKAQKLFDVRETSSQVYREIERIIER